MLPIPFNFSYTSSDPAIPIEPISLLATASLWYDFSLATASVDTANRNTISGTGPYYSRLYENGKSLKHLFRTTNLTGYPLYVFNSEKSRYVCNTLSGTGNGYFLATFSSIDISVTQSLITSFHVLKTPTSMQMSSKGSPFAPPVQFKYFDIQKTTGSPYGLSLAIIFSGATTGSSILSSNTTYCDVVDCYTDSKSLVVGTSSWLLIISTFSNSTQSASSYMKVNGVVATNSMFIGGGVGSDVISYADFFTQSVSAAESIVFDTILTTSQIDSVETWIKYKWNISY